MDKAKGPTYTLEETELNIGDANYVQEALAIIGTTTAYALLGYVPATARSVLIFVDGLILLQGTEYTIDGRKIAFTDAMAGTEAVVASYITTNEVATIPAVEIAFDIPGQNVRVGVGGVLQILEGGVWYDMLPQTDPITGGISFVPSDVASLNQ